MRLNVKIKQLGGIMPSKDFRLQAKNRLLQKIQLEKASWSEIYLANSAKIESRPAFRTLARERLLYQISQEFASRWFFDFQTGMKKLLAWTLLSSFVVMLTFSSFFFLPHTVEASYSTYLIILQGHPTLKRLGENWTPARSTQELFLGDHLHTGPNDIAEIYFFDNSVARLAGNTDLTITALEKNLDEEKVSLKLDQGRVWNKVLQSLSSSSDFSLKTYNSLVSAQNATFDVEVKNQKSPTQILVVNHLVDLKVLQTQNAQVVAKTKITEGFKIAVQKSITQTGSTIEETAQITPLDLQNVQNGWFKQNLIKDEEHIKTLQAKNQTQILASAGILPDSPLYSVKETIQTAKQAFTPDTNADQIKTIKQKLQEIAALHTKAETNQSEQLLQEFTILFQQTAQNPALKPNLAGLLAEVKSDYLTVLPGSNLYPIKETLRQLELEISVNPAETQAQNTTEKLFEAQDLIEDGQTVLARDLLVSLNQETEPATTSGAILTEEDKKTTLLQKSAELQILQTLGDKVKDTNDPALAPLVAQMQQTATAEINLLNPPVETPPEQVEEPVKIIAVKTAVAKTVEPALEPVVKKTSAEKQIENLVTKVNKYQTTRGKTNVILSHLKRIPNNSKQIPYLIQIKKALPPEHQYLVTKKILEITKKD